MQARLYDILQMSTSGATATRTCCENGRPIMTDPHTGQTICSCQYGSSLLNYPRVPGLTDTVYGASAYAAAQGYMPLGAEGSAFYSPLNGPYDVKENPDGLRGLAQPASYFPYDPSMAVYPYGTGYGGLDLNARRKNATRETTNTLKAWLYEHRKNPYPTKGEKIMLAIITKMTLTQVSTWFANARRRLKKENKMTWSPRNRSEDSADNLDSEGETENKESENGDSSGNTASTSGPEKDERRSEGSPGHIDPEETQGSLSEKLVDAPNDSDADSDDQDAMEPIKAGKLTLCNASKDKHAKVYHRTDAALPLAQQQRHLQNSDFREADSAKQSGANSQSSSQSERHSPTRPKIWSVSQFLPSSPSSSEGSAKSPGLTPSGRIHPSPGYLYLQSASQSWNTGRYGALGTYPMSMSHATLSYPYTLSSQATSKSALGVGSSGLSGVDLLHSADKLAATQKGLFSPARDIDGLRNRIFAKDAGAGKFG